MNGYEVGELLGRGGMGEVYLGRHTGLNRPVAIKFLRGALAEHSEFYERFVREAQLCARLDHPGIVRVYDAGVDAGRPYLVMELLEGESLHARLKRGPLPQAEAVSVISEVLGALAHAHAEGVVHRDIKPGNIFLTQSGAVKVMDFGIAKLAGAVSLTMTGAQLGTPEYMSPEQVEGQSADARSDLYAVGVVLYEMLTGDVPFQAETPLVVMKMQLDKTPPALPGWVWPGLAAVVSRAMAKQPAQRYSTAAAMQDALLSAGGAEVAARSAPSAGRSAQAAPGGAPTTTAPGARHGPAVVMGGVVLALIGGAALLRQPGHPGTGSPSQAPTTTSPATSTSSATREAGPTATTDPDSTSSGSESTGPTPAPAQSDTSQFVQTPRSGEEWNNQGWALYQQRRWPEAEQAFLEAVRLKPNEALYQARLGNARRNQKKWAEAETAYAEAVRLAPDKAVYHSSLALAMHMQEKWTAAEQEYRRAIELKPAEPAYHNRLGNTLKRQGRFPEAAVEYLQAIKLDPQPVDPWDNLGDVCVQMGKWEAAVAAYGQAVDRQPADRERRERLAQKLAAAREQRSVE